jgi:hypothetical protein
MTFSWGLACACACAGITVNASANTLLAIKLGISFLMAFLLVVRVE